jgi:hypothetical protein
MKKPNITPGEWIVNDGLLQQQDLIDALTADLQEPSRHWTAVGIEDKEGYAESVAYCHPMNAQAIAALPKLLEALESLAKIGADGVIERRETGKPMWSAMDEIRKLTSASLLAAGYTNK